MHGGERRLFGAFTVMILGGLLLTGMALLPERGASAGHIPPPSGSATDPGAAAAAGESPSASGSDAIGPTADGPATAPASSATPKHRPKPTPGPTPTPGRTAPPATKPTAPPTSAPTIAPTRPPSPRPTVAPTPRPTATPTPPPVANCTLFPSSNVWNKRVDALPVASNSATMIAGIGAGSALHPDFSSLAWNGGLGYGIPFNKVNLSTPTSHVSFDYADESDPGPYPIPSSPKIEGGSDRHLLLWDTQGCNLYELFDAVHTASGWTAGSGAIWDLTSNALRPNGWTSADAAGLPILPGLARYDEVAAGAILHALRFTAPRTCANHIYPARHDAGSSSCASYPPMGLRVRLKASVDISGFGPQSRAILTALKRYGMLLADNGSPWYVTGAPAAGWNDDELHALGSLHGSDFEVVDTSGLR